jgi:hypothetical protein
MASSRVARPTTNELVKTYGGVTRNYTALQTWEDAYTEDCVTNTRCPVLECYDDAASFDDTVVITGATTNATYFRVIRAAAGNGHDGTPNNGFTINDATTAVGAVSVDLAEDYCQVQDLIVICTCNNATAGTAIRTTNNYPLVVACIAKGTNAGTGTGNGINVRGTNGLAVNCLAYECKSYGLVITIAAGQTNRAYNCTAVGNGVQGFRISSATADATSYAVLTNCLGTENAADFVASSANGNKTVTYCCSLDATADDWSGAGCLTGVTVTYANAGGDDWHTTDSDIVGQGTSLAADGTFPFDDDIDKQTRPAAWDIGMDGGSIPLVVPDLAHAHALDALALSQVHILTVADLADAQALDAFALTQAHVLAVAELLHAQALDALALTQAHTLVVQELAHAHALEEPAVTAATILAVADLLHSQALDALGITQVHMLVVDELGHTQAMDALSLTQAHTLALTDLLHGHTLDSVSFSVAHGLLRMVFTARGPSIRAAGRAPHIEAEGRAPRIGAKVGS